MKHVRIDKDVPAEGLKKGDVVNFMSDEEADKRIAADVGKHVIAQFLVNKETGERTFVAYVEPPAPPKE